MITVAFQGEAGAYSEDAAIKFFGNEIKTIACESFSEVFASVSKSVFGIVPIENSLEGTVGQVADLLLEKNVKIYGEEASKINHCLIAGKNSRIESIKTVYSHPQALAQCRKFLEKMKFNLVPFYDTAGSVKIIKNGRMKDSAAIASERAASIYDMKILARNIQYAENNYTRFFILSKKNRPHTGNDKTSLILETNNVPGALYNALGVFAKRHINLTKIESRPIKRKVWDYIFYVDVDGHEKEPLIKEAVEELKKRALFVKILGSYPKQSALM